MTGEERQPGEVELELDWSRAETVDVKVLSQILIQLGNPAAGQPDGVYLILDDATPPIAPSDNEEARLRDIARYEGKLPVNVHGRYYMSRARMGELIEVLQRVAAQYDEIAKGGH